MIILLLFLILISATTSLCLAVSLKKNLELSDKLNEIANVIDEELDVFESCYTSIDNKSKLEVFYDDPVVRELNNDMKRALHSIHKIAYRLVSQFEDETHQEKDEKENSVG